MLNGPPGSGKSILASITAKQAGYKPFVINVRYFLTINLLKYLIVIYKH